MRKETILKRSGALLLAVSLIYIASNFTSHTIPALESVFWDTPNDCTTINKREPHFVAVPGSGMTTDLEGNPKPDFVMQVRLQAAKKHIDNIDNRVISVGLLDGSSDPSGKNLI